ncbi:MAG: thiolase family protein [Acidimicrobiales bacterium]
MINAVIVDAVRTPIGKRNGALSPIHAVDLAAAPLRALVERNDLDPTLIEDVIMGCTMTVGEQAMNIGRNAALAAGFPDTVPGTTVDRQCGSAQQAVHFAAQAVMAGAMDVVIAAGVESMSRVPIGSTSEPGPGQPYGPTVTKRFEFIHQGLSAERIAQKWQVSRQAMDELSVESHHRAARAASEGRFDNEIIAIEVPAQEPVLGQKAVPTESGTQEAVLQEPEPRLVDIDEGVRPNSTYEILAGLRPAFGADGSITAGSSSQISDGAAAVLIMSEERAGRLGLRPRARFVAFAVAANDPVIMLTAPIPATSLILSKAKMSLEDMGVIEINEAFASVVLAWASEFHPDMARVNPNGGAIALGHPTGCSGARIMATMLNELERSGGRWGLQTMCEGGGMANATIIERL